MSLITPAELRERLILNGVSDSVIEDDSVLGNLINLKIEELISLTSIPIKDTSRKQIIPNFKGKLFESEYYPINDINSFKINNTELTDDDYLLDETNGIFYLKKAFNGLLVIEYTQKVSEDFLTSIINPLIVDMITYHYSNNAGDNGSVSSIKEMDTTVSYDTGNSLGNRIYSRIESLKQNNLYSARVRWL